jgi:membrane protease YdiL (CAAX protease family)
MSVFFSFALRELSRRNARKRQQQIEGGIYLDPMNVYKQVLVLLIGLAAGIILVMTNIYINIAGHANVLLASAFGTIDPTAFYLGMLAGVSEELFFRGFFQTFFEIFFGGTLIARFLAPVPAALIFAWFHFFAYADPVIFFVLFALGLILGLLHSFSNDIGVPMLAHVVNNTFAMMGGVVAVINQNAILIGGLIAVAIIMYICGVAHTAKTGGRLKLG